MSESDAITPTPAEQPAEHAADGIRCPYCGESSPRRLLGSARWPRTIVPPVSLIVPCYCHMCEKDWEEVYRFVGAMPTGGAVLTLTGGRQPGLPLMVGGM